MVASNEERPNSMTVISTKPSYRGPDWATDRPALAQALATLDALHALTLGFAPDDVAPGAADEVDMLKLMADMAQSALCDLDILTAEQMPQFLTAPQSRCSAFEARELLTDLLMLCIEARDSMRTGWRTELPRALTFELGYLTGRIKELVKSVDIAA